MTTQPTRPTGGPRSSTPAPFRTTRTATGVRGRAVLAALGLALAAAVLPATAVHASPRPPDIDNRFANPGGNPQPPEPPDPPQWGPQDLANPTENPEPPLPPDPTDNGPDDKANPVESPEPPQPPNPNPTPPADNPSRPRSASTPASAAPPPAPTTPPAWPSSAPPSSSPSWWSRPPAATAPAPGVPGDLQPPPFRPQGDVDCRARPHPCGGSRPDVGTGSLARDCGQPCAPRCPVGVASPPGDPTAAGPGAARPWAQDPPAAGRVLGGRHLPARDARLPGRGGGCRAGRVPGAGRLPGGRRRTA
jgi:hypothetical protein